MTASLFDVVIPTSGRDSLSGLVSALREGGLQSRIVVVDDRRDATAPPAGLAHLGAEVVHGRGRGPAAARNAGWAVCTGRWVVFLDDDVVPEPGWVQAVRADLGRPASDVAAVQGRVRVPLPEGRAPTDWERNVAGLESARWATADMAVRRDVLEALGGFDERFPRAYREDSDLGLRIVEAGFRILAGGREVRHPVGPAPAWVSVARQAGNADDVLMRALHGPRWREVAGAPAGRLHRHLATTASAATALLGCVAGNRRLAALGGVGWVLGTAELAWARIAPGPRSRREVGAMLATSAILPAAASWHRTKGRLGLRSRLRRQTPARRAPVPVWGQRVATRDRDGARTGAAGEGDRGRRGTGARVPAAVLFDRDGTLVHDVPYNGDPARVVPMPGAREALDRLRAAAVPVAMVSNQSGVARGRLTMEQVARVNARVQELLGPLRPALVCPHGPADGCGCRKPSPGMVLQAADALGVPPSRCAFVGDIGSDVDAALAAGARPVLVPTCRTNPEEVGAAPEVAPDLLSAVTLLLGEDDEE